MPAGRFDAQLTIKAGCLSPTGPLGLAPGETPVRLDVWVFQKGGACVAVQHDFPNSSRWTANPDPQADHTGAMLVPGAATGMALLVYTTAGQTKTFQWDENITLV